MMLPTRRSPTDLPPPRTPLPAGQVTAAATTGAAPNPPHSDYDHQPLLVGGLEHYVKPEEGKRFRVG